MQNGRLIVGPARRVVIALAIAVAAVASVAIGGGAPTADADEHEQCTQLRSDDFEGDALDTDRWEVVREDSERLSVTDGALHIVSHPSDIHGGDEGLPNIVVQDLPGDTDPWSITTEMTWDPTQNYQNAGLIVYGDDANFIKAGMVHADGRRLEAFKETGNSPGFLGNTPVLDGTFPSTFHMRLVSSDGNAMQAQYSDDGQAWTDLGDPTNLDGILSPRIGVYATASTQAGVGEPTASFQSVEIEPDEEVCAPSCEALSDEFDGAELNEDLWLRHTRNDGTPMEGAMAPTLGGGQLTMPTNDFELDGNSGTTALGPVNFIGQDLPALGEDWEVETQFTIEHTGGWQHAGLIVWQADNNFFRSTITNSLSGISGQRQIYVEQSKDNPTSTEGDRQTAGGNHTILLNQPQQPVTIQMRYARVEGADSLEGQYKIIAPESAATPDWVDLPGTNAGWVNTGGLDLNPAGGPRRDSEGSRIGLLAAGNFPGSTGNFPYEGVPAEMVVDYFDVTTDDCPDPGNNAPVIDSISADPNEGDAPLEVDFTAEASDADDDPLTYSWDLDGDESEDSTEQNPTHTYTEAGVYEAELTVSDGQTQVSDSVTVTVNDDEPDPEYCPRSDSFEGAELNADRWTVIREDAERLSVSDGALHLVSAPMDIFQGDQGLPNIVLQPLPGGGSEPWSITTELTWEPTQNFQNAGLIVYEDDDNYIKTGMVWNEGAAADGRNFELIKELGGIATFPGGSSDGEGIPATFFLRLVSQDGNAVVAEFSADGETWSEIGTTGTNLDGLSDPMIGVYATAATQPDVSEPTASFHSVEIEPECGSSCLSDEFDEAELDTDRWTTVRGEDGEPSVSGGSLVLPVAHGDINEANTGPITYVAQPAPDGAWSAEIESITGAAFHGSGQSPSGSKRT